MAPTALLVATNNRTSSSLTEKLEQTGIFEGIIPFQHGKDALHHLEGHRADMLFCAVESSNKRSVNWIQRFQGHSDQNDLPLVAFTPEKDQEGRIISLENGATDCVSLETHIKELTARINAVLKRQQRILELRQTTEQLSQMAQTDALTALGNRAYFDRSMAQEVARIDRNGSPFSLMMVDIDHFKRINDTYGHHTGDQVLKAIANVLRDSARTSDIVCRYGGEEFGLILPETTAPKALVLANRIHANLRQLTRQLETISQPITVSIGIKCASGKTPVQSRQIFEAADQALYQAKEKGRNRTEVAKSNTPVVPIDPKRAVGHH